VGLVWLPSQSAASHLHEWVDMVLFVFHLAARIGQHIRQLAQSIVGLCPDSSRDPEDNRMGVVADTVAS
jgi:hypothetical protein